LAPRLRRRTCRLLRPAFVALAVLRECAVTNSMLRKRLPQSDGGRIGAGDHSPGR
jgi:hypothetical protein